MKKSFSSLDECVGQKLVDSVPYGSHMMLVFETGYLVLEANQRFPEEDASITWKEVSPEQLTQGPFFFPHLIKVGIFTEEEYNALEAKVKKANAAARLRHDRAQYEQLKKRFEGL